MKKIFGFILVVCCCALFAFGENFTQSARLEQTNTTYVYVCTGSFATKYHCRSNCSGLGKCKGKIVKMTEAAAKKEGRTRCGICYR